MLPQSRSVFVGYLGENSARTYVAALLAMDRNMRSRTNYFQEHGAWGLTDADVGMESCGALDGLEVRGWDLGGALSWRPDLPARQVPRLQ